ncbi:WD40 repeat domain-containing protein [bacterium]|nr:MAG: WD40 repeat domain-containing protein [bacterium]
MLPQSKGTLVFLIALPLLLVIPLWQAAHKRPQLWAVLAATPTSFALSNDGSLVAYSESNGQIGLWPYAGKRRTLQTDGTGAMNSSIYASAKLRFSQDSKTLLGSNIRVGDSTTALCAWDADNGRINWTTLSNYKDDFCRYWPSNDGKLAAQRSYNAVKVLDISGVGQEQDSTKSSFARTFPTMGSFQARIAEPKGGSSRLQTVALSPDGKVVVGATQKGFLEFWDAKTGAHQSRSAKPTSVVSSTEWELQYSPDGRFVALFDGTTISVWDVAARNWSTTIVASVSPEVALCWMPDSNSLWTGSGTVQQWSVPKLQRLRDLPIGGPVAVSGDGHTLVTRSLAASNIPGGIWKWNIG